MINFLALFMVYIPYETAMIISVKTPVSISRPGGGGGGLIGGVWMSTIMS
ncbi:MULTISPECIES: hypothetical protein [unclassified Polaribacter]|jgi:hypothetical protein|nr:MULTISPECIES: hypothetical protein [unclassified Polaribacter]QXP62541.1 hypothetical protein H0I27_11685 [Polaribacter sp. HaHaR_3_91]QXP68291.1 hypothetical protein H0I28_07260 [Polaribacter sp. AHE13PA]QXP70465.1 hypothetical protein H0I29_17935 [Polaribacter sp. R2A056_3_33]